MKAKKKSNVIGTKVAEKQFFVLQDYVLNRGLDVLNHRNADRGARLYILCKNSLSNSFVCVCF